MIDALKEKGEDFSLVAFVVRHESGVWKYTINNESFGQFSRRDHAISAAIQHIDRILVEASRR